MRCPRCQHDNRAAAKFCEECGALTGVPAPATPARFVSPGAYTPRHLAEKILTSRAALEGERKQVTVLFCDLAGSTALAERLGADAMHGLLDRFFDLALAGVHRYEGTVNQFLGDGFMALFGAPVAHEDHARRAVLAALAVQRALRERRAELGPPDAGPIDARMGVNTGLVVVGKIGDNLRMDYTAVGDTTNVAARVQQLAEPGAICLSETTYRLVEPYVDCEALGERTLKGKTEPVAMYRVRGSRAVSGPGRAALRPIGSPLVGRDSDMTVLTGCLERLLAGQGGVVGILGEAGLGKSRLVTEANRKFAGRDLLWLEGRALSFGQGLSYWPLLEILRRWAGITEEDSDPQSRAKLERQLRTLFPDEFADVFPYLASLLGLAVPPELEHRVRYLDGHAMGRQIFRSVRRLVERLARERPLVLVFEDLHWADQSSTELVEHLFQLVDIVPLLLCGVGRPERESSAARLRAIARTRHPGRYTEILLAPLSPTVSSALVDNLLGTSEPAGRLKELILQKTEGNPFFVEEVIRALIAAKTLRWDAAAAAWRISQNLDQLILPDTLQGVIMARVDRLDGDLKQVLKIASVIGRSFFYRVLKAIAEAMDHLDENLDELQELELIREKRRVPELEYVFKHGLVHEATYQSILLDRCRELHRRVADSIETLFAEQRNEFASLLAYHYARADDWEKAREYLLKAGDHAGRLAADAEALVHYRQAIDAFARAFGSRWDPLQRAMIERKIGEALYRRGAHQEALEYLNRALELLGAPYPTSRRGVRLAVARELLRQVGHRLLPHVFLRATPDLPDVAAEERSSLYLARGWIDTVGEQENLLLDTLLLLNHSERNGLVTGIARASAGVGFTCDLLGWFGVASRYHRRAIALANQVKQPTTMGLAYLALGLHERYIGQWDEAGDHFRRAAATYHAAGDLRGWGISSMQIEQLEFFRGRFAPAMEGALELARVGRDAGDPLLFGWGLWGQALVEGHSGELDAAVTKLEQELEIISAIPSYWDMLAAIGLLGSYLARQGRLTDAVSRLEAGERLISVRGLRGHGTNYVWNALAETYLLAAEGRQGRDRDDWLGKARPACQEAFRQGQRTTTGLATAIRLCGRYEWLKGRPSKANQWWRRSLAVAEKLDARYELGMTHLEIWQRTGEPGSRESAELILSQIGASALLGQRPPG